MKDNTNHATGGVGLCSLFGIVFLVLKLCGLVDWRWLWVLAPFWGGLALHVLVAVILIALTLKNR